MYLHIYEDTFEWRYLSRDDCACATRVTKPVEEIKIWLKHSDTIRTILNVNLLFRPKSGVAVELNSFEDDKINPLPF